jgi:hypothetical protein
MPEPLLNVLEAAQIASHLSNAGSKPHESFGKKQVEECDKQSDLKVRCCHFEQLATRRILLTNFCFYLVTLQLEITIRQGQGIQGPLCPSFDDSLGKGWR